MTGERHPEPQAQASTDQQTAAQPPTAADLMADQANPPAQLPVAPEAQPLSPPPTLVPPIPAAGYGTASAPPGYTPPPPAFTSLTGPARSVLARLDPSGVRPTILVASIIVAVFFGAQLLNALLPAAAAGPGPQPGAGGSVDIGPLRVQVPQGWQVGEGPGGPGTRLARGSVAIDFQSSPFQGEAAALYTAFVNEALAPYGTGFQATEPSLVQVGPGIPGARGTYAGIFGSGANAGQVEGLLTCFVTDGNGVVVDAWGPTGSLRALVGDIDTIIGTLQVR